ncbi:FHA domain-containing protein [Mycobacterium servetii]|uniref:FHA domain-containing protein n=1 Tax=Mycobacterium servetii TaxID=3237418 RepID=A0ABV4C953_9MYCO
MRTIQEASPPALSEPRRTQSALVIHVGPDTYTFDTRDAPILVGREASAHVIVDDDRISRTHMRLEHTADDGWVAYDQSRNGIFADRVQHSTIPIRDGITIHLGNPDGIPVAFGPQPPAPEPTLNDDDISEQLPVKDPGIARAGAAVAARRQELKLTQRYLARQGIINAGGLIEFEKGRRWPRKATRTKLEDALNWPHGEIARRRREGNITAADSENTGGTTNTGQASLMADAVEVALGTVNDAIEKLPDTNDATFSARAGKLLADLRRLESVAANAAATAKGNPDLALVLSSVRRRYKDLMLRAARAPGATLGQQLYAARYRAELSVEETANAAGVPAEMITAAEAELPLNDKTKAALSMALKALTRRR